MLPLQVLDPNADRLAIKIPNLVAAPQWTLEPGETFTALWGTGYEEGRAFVEVEHRGKVLQSYWTRPKVTQADDGAGRHGSDARWFHGPRDARCGRIAPTLNRDAWMCPGPTNS